MTYVRVGLDAMHSVSPTVLHLFLILRVAHLAPLFLDKVHDKVHKHEDDENRAHHSHESPEWQLAFAVEEGRDTLISILAAARVSASLFICPTNAAKILLINPV